MSFDKNVFINCPFDTSYINDLLKPMIYLIVRIGYIPRLSLEVSDSGQIRLEKITDIIKNCKYSIHDLSLVKSIKAKEFARMNMPFELGIDYGLRKGGIKPLDSKQFLILEAVKYDYMKALSDINGFDIKVHGNNTEKLFENLYKWSSETLKINKQDPPLKLFYDYTDFIAALFADKAIELRSEKLARNYLENVSIPEYIQEISERL
jgi:hypothetical protein